MFMKKLKMGVGLFAIVLLNPLFYGSIAHALTILPGHDLFETPEGPDTYMDFSTVPIPADFFGPGSDPFTGTVVLKGKPLNTTPDSILGPTDTIVKRTSQAELPTCGSTTTVDIEIVALSLTSASPITVTYNGGQNPELWDVDVCLSSDTAQSPGSMTINHDCPEGGTFSATLPVLPKFTYTHLTDVRVLDFGNEGYPPIPLSTTDGHWTHSDPGFGIITSPGGLTVDHDCDGNPNVTVAPSSNFYAGIGVGPCNCVDPAQTFDRVLTILQNPVASHAVLPPILPDVIPTLNEWGMIILALLLLTIGTVAVIRRRKEATAKG
jgi:hypothetical protein